MADETTASVMGSLVYAEMISSQVRDKLAVRKVIEPFFERFDISNLPTLAGSFGVGDSVTFAAVTDGSTSTNQAWTPSDAVATAAQAAAMVELTDLAASAAIPGSVDKMIKSMTTGALAYTEALMGALFGGNSAHSVGSTGVDLTLAVLDAAIASVEISAEGFADQLVAILHPQQVADLRAAILATSGSPALQRDDVVNLFGAAPGSGLAMAYKGTYGNVPILASAYCPDANAAADHAGVVMVPGAAFGYVSNWDFRLDVARSISGLATRYVPSVSIGVVEKDEAMYCDVISDHV